MAVGTPYIVAGPTALTTSSTDASVTTSALAHSGDTLFAIVAERLTTAAVLSAMSGPTGGTQEFLGRKHSANAEGVSLARQKLTSDFASGSALTLTLDATTSRKVVLAIGVPGLADANRDQWDTGNQGTTGNPTSGTAAAASLGDAIALFLAQHNTTGTTETTSVAPTGYTKLAELVAGASSWTSLFAAYKILAAPAAQSAIAYTPSLVTNTAWVVMLPVYVGVAAAVVSPPRPVVVSQAVQRAANW